MAEAAKTELSNSTEQAYAAATETVVAKPEAVTPTVEVKPVVAKTEAPAPQAAAQAAPAAVKAPEAKPVLEAPAKRKYVRKVAVAATPVLAAAPKAKPVAEKLKPAPRKLAVKSAKPVTAKPITSPTNLISKLKENTMATTTKTVADDMTTKIQDTVKDVQARAKTAFEKSQAMFGDAGEFTKGNLEAIVESGKILATGVQAMGKTYVEEVKSSFETVSADVKELTSVKSPTDFVKLQSTMMRKYFDNVVAYNSKSAEAALKLANDAFQPISSRVSLAVEKVKKAA